jgi:putative FmdB family regulatory protein
MPTYDYKCEKCGHEFEEMLPISRRNEPTETPCSMRILDANQDPQGSDCNGEVKKIILAPGFVYDNIAGIKGHTKKPPDWFGDRMKHIKKTSPGGNLDYNF